MQSDIDILFKVGFLSNLDYYLAKTLAEIANEDNQIVILSAALVSKTCRDGHICLDINQSASQSISLLTASEDKTVSEKAGFDNKTEIRLPDKEQWIKALRSSKLVGEDSDCPLVFDSDDKLYLAKYFDYQKRIVKNILQRIKSPLPDIDKSTLITLLDKYFKGQNRGISEQKKAVLKSVVNNFLIISGGPGTGKTYITDKIATVFEKTFKASDPVTIVNTAPTGKAASKLQAGMTIHRLLKINNTAKLGKSRIQQNIVADLVIIDEASMIDIALMTKLLEAIPLSSKVIIIGDKNQLGSIETGSVFADICGSERLDKHIVNLDYNFRSGKEKGIDKLAKAINSGDQQLIESILTKTEYNEHSDLPDIAFININDSSELTLKLKELIIKGYTPYLKEDNLQKAYNNLGKFRIICSHRKHFFGTNNLNIITEKLLQEPQIHGIKQSFLKSVLMITKNDYNKLLFNGDTGMVIKTEGEKKAVFMDENSILHSYHLSELKTFEQAFAITVHKSQGSEFDHVLFILPPAPVADSSFLTRELIYTAITRARKKVTIAGNIDVVKEAVKTHSKKESGITKLLDKTSSG